MPNTGIFKKDLVDAVAADTKLTKTDVENCLNSLTDVISNFLKKGNDVSLIGFGTFKVMKTKARVARNPRTGEEIKVPAGKRVKFTVGKTLKTLIDSKK